MNFIKYILGTLILIKIVFSYNVSILRSDLDLKNVTLTQDILGYIDTYASDVSNYSFEKNDIIIKLNSQIPKEFKNFLSYFDENVIKVRGKDELKVNLPVLLTYADTESGNELVKGITNINELSLGKRADTKGFLECIGAIGVTLVAGCTWAAVVSAGASCVAGGLTAMLSAGYCAVAYG
ncbi:hypothetical protein H8356DRAFT_1318969, partial [Neocallimastix lanati (nom. inval.)]